MTERDITNQDNKLVVNNFFIIIPIICCMIMFSSLSGLDLVSDKAKEIVEALAHKSESHNFIVKNYFKCREAKVDRGECILQSTYLTENTYGKDIASKALIDLQSSLIESDNFEKNYDVFLSAVTFRAWRYKIFGEE